jgi:tetratricopeptide (TPR) repeat protein
VEESVKKIVNELTAVIISHNNETSVINTINSVKGLAKEIILIDLQSSDNTKNLAQKYNVRYILENKNKPENELFNRAIATSKTKYILYLFGYEVLVKSSIVSIESILANEGDAHDGYVCQIVTEIGSPIIAEKNSYAVRLVKKTETVSFENMFRSSPVNSIFNSNGHIETTNIIIQNKSYKYNEEHVRSIYLSEAKYLLSHPKNDPYYYYQLAKQMYHLTKYNEAIELLKKIDVNEIEDKGFVASVYNYLARSMQRKKMISPAITLYIKSLDFVMSQNIANMEVASLYSEAKKPLEASMGFERFYISYLDDEKQRFSYYKSGKVFTKEDGYLPFVDDDFKLQYNSIKQKMGCYYIENKRFEEGDQLLNEMLSKFGQGSSEYYSILESLSVSYEFQIKNDELRAALDGMLKIDLARKAKAPLFIHLRKLIELNYSEHHLDEVMRFIQLGLQSFKYSIFFNYYRAELYYTNQNFDKSLEELDFIISEYPKNRYKDIPIVEIITLKGDCFYEQKNFLKAVESYKIAYQADKKSVKALHKLGQCLIELQKPDQAKLIYSQALMIDPENKLIQHDLDQLAN